MLYSEFVDCTGCHVSAEEYARIEEQYYEFPGNKDEFCRAWVKANPATVKAAKAANKAAKEKASRDSELWQLKNRIEQRYNNYDKYRIIANDVLNDRSKKLLKEANITVFSGSYIGDISYAIYRYFVG